MLKDVEIGDCFIDSRGLNKKDLLLIINKNSNYDNIFVGIKLLKSGDILSLPIHRLTKLTKIGNIYKDEILKILFVD